MADAELLKQLRGNIRAIESNAPSGNRETGEHPKSAKGMRARNGKPKGSTSALDKIVALVNVSDRSEHTLRERLLNDGFGEEETETALEKAKGYGIIDDARYAEVLIRSRISQGKGSAGIERELQSQQIDIDCVNGWPFDFPVSDEEELERALSVLDKKPPRSKNLREGAYRRLIGKGYSSSVASTASRMWVERQPR